MKQTKEEDRVRPIVLKGQEAADFYQRLRHPNKEQNAKNAERLKNIHIEETEDGFTAWSDDWDLPDLRKDNDGI